MEIVHRSDAVDSALDRKMPLFRELGEDRWQSAPPEQIIDKVTQALDQKSVGIDDPRLYFLGAYPLFQFVIFTQHAHRVLAEDFARPDGYWKNTITQVTEKAQHDLTDVVFLTHAAEAVASVVELSKRDEIDVDVSWARKYLEKNSEVIRATGTVINILTQQNTPFGESYTANITQLPRTVNKARLYPEVSQEVIRIFAGHILHNFTMTASAPKDNISMYPIFQDRGTCVGNGIEVLKELPGWAEPLVWVRSVFDGEEREAVTELISEKVVRDVATEFADIQRIHQGYWDGEFIGGVVSFLQQVGLSVEQRKTIYDRLPGFLTLPSDGQNHMYSSKRFVPLVEDEIEEIGKIS